MGDDRVAVADRLAVINHIGQLSARRLRGIEDVLMNEGYLGQLQKRIDLEAVAVVVGDSEKLRVGEERDHGNPLKRP